MKTRFDDVVEDGLESLRAWERWIHHVSPVSPDGEVLQHGFVDELGPERVFEVMVLIGCRICEISDLCLKNMTGVIGSSLPCVATVFEDRCPDDLGQVETKKKPGKT